MNVEVITNMSNKGLFKGYIPSKIGSYGAIDAIDLVFEKEDENE